MTIKDDLIEAASADEPFKQAKKESDDDFRKRLLVAVTELDDDSYAAIPKAAKKWIKDAVNSFNEDGEVPDFPEESAPKITAASKKKAPDPEPDVEEDPEEVEDDPEEDDEPVDEPEDEPEDDDEPAPPPAKKRGRPAKPKAPPREVELEDEDDEPAPPPKKRGRPAKAKAPPPEDEEESDPVHEVDDEEPDPEPVDKKKSKPVKAAKPAKEEEAPKPKANGHTNGRSSGGGLALMRTLLAKDPNLSPREILERCQESGYTIDIHTIASNKSTFMAAIRTLQGLNMLRKNVF